MDSLTDHQRVMLDLEARFWPTAWRQRRRHPCARILADPLVPTTQPAPIHRIRFGVRPGDGEPAA